jgi:hypothetical protein
MHAAALEEGGKGEKGRMSVHTALVAWVWLWLCLLDASARCVPSPHPRPSSSPSAGGIGAESEEMDLTHLALSLPLRSRLEPPLPTTVLGSPIVHAAASTPFPSSPTTSPTTSLPISTGHSPLTTASLQAESTALTTFDAVRKEVLLHEAVLRRVSRPEEFDCYELG